MQIKMYENYTWFVVTENNHKGIPIGMVGMAKNGYLAALLIDSKYRNKGVATKLMRAVEAGAKKRKIKELTMATHSTNIPTQRLLKRCGWDLWIKGSKEL